MRRALLLILYFKRPASLFLAVFLSVSMMLMAESSRTRFARLVTTAVFNTGRFTFSWGIYMLDLWRENERLRYENLELADQLAYQRLAVRENRRLRELLGFRQRRSLVGSAIASTVVGHDVDRVVNALILDKGARDGVRKNMAVITAEGLVGRIFESYPTSSSVQIIRDVNSKVSAVVEDGDIFGFVTWREGPDLVMYGLPRQKLPAVGKRVYTTGFGVYPAGMLIGAVASAPLDDVELHASVPISPAVDFSQIQEVFVIKGSERSDIWDDGDGTGPFTRPDIQ